MALTGTLLTAALLGTAAAQPAAAATSATISNGATGTCMIDTGSGRGVAMAEICAVGAPGTTWIVSGYGDGTYRLQNKGTGRCLDESLDYGLRMFTCQPPGPYQKYQAWKTSGMGDINYFRLQVMSTKTCLDDSFDIVHRPTLATCVSASNPSAAHEGWYIDAV